MIRKFLQINLILFFTSFTFLYANEIEDLSVLGNQRISKETIQVLGKIKLPSNNIYESKYNYYFYFDFDYYFDYDYDL